MRGLAKLVIILDGLLLPCWFAAQASDYALSGPTLGLVADQTANAVRPILGIPGAATWGAPLAVDFATIRTVVAPGGDFALVVARENYRTAIVRATGGARGVAPGGASRFRPGHYFLQPARAKRGPLLPGGTPSDGAQRHA